MSASHLSLFFIIIYQYNIVNGYTCNNATCIVNCTSTPAKCSDGIIDGHESQSLNVLCNQPSICNNLTINCPHNVTSSNCQLNCDGNNACNNIQFNALIVNSSINCGNGSNALNANIAMPICSNILIQSLSSTMLVNNNNNNITNISNSTMSQRITLTCIAEMNDINDNIGTCTNITFQNLGDYPSNVSNITQGGINKYVSINCDAADLVWNGSLNHACYNLMIINNTVSINEPVELNFMIYNAFSMSDVYISNTTAATFNISNYGHASNIWVPSQSINEMNIYNDINALMTQIHTNNTMNLLENNGMMHDIEINQFENITIGSNGYLNHSNILSLNLENIINIKSGANILYCDFKFYQDIDHSNNTLQLWHDGMLQNNTISIHGSVTMIVNGDFQYNILNLTNIYDYPLDPLPHNSSDDFMNTMILRLNGSSTWINNTIYAYDTDLLDIKTNSLFSGWIFTNDSCNNFSLECSNDDDMDNTCQNLTLYTKSSNNSNWLSCNGYGCQYLTIYSERGLNDINFAATDCPCSIDCIDNCMGEWNIYCDNLTTTAIEYDIHALFANDKCNASDYCCGRIVNRSEDFFVCQPNIYQNVVCKHSVGLDIAVVASLAMAGVIVFFFIFLGIRYVYRKVKQTEMKKELERKRKLEQKKKNKIKSGSSKKRKLKSQRLKTITNEDTHTTNLLDSGNDDDDDTKTASTPATVN